MSKYLVDKPQEAYTCNLRRAWKDTVLSLDLECVASENIFTNGAKIHNHGRAFANPNTCPERLADNSTILLYVLEMSTLPQRSYALYIKAKATATYHP